VFPGDYTYYLWRKQKETAGEEVAPASPGPAASIARGRAASGAPPAPTSKGAAAPAGFQSEARPAGSAAARLQAKRLQGDLRRLAREEEAILAELERLAAARRELEKALSDGEVYRDGARVKLLLQELEANTRRQEELTSRWEAVDRELQSRR
jgi:ATP-binding cassette subfamily F protein 3